MLHVKQNIMMFLAKVLTLSCKDLQSKFDTFAFY